MRKTSQKTSQGEWQVIVREHPNEECRYLVFVWPGPDSAPFRMYRLDEADALLLIRQLVDEFRLDPDALCRALKEMRGQK